MKKNIKYTVFGHNGFLGANIVKYLKKKIMIFFCLQEIRQSLLKILIM